MTFTKLSELQTYFKQLDTEIVERKLFINQKDNEWKESENGKKFINKTETLRNFRKCLIELISHLIMFLED